MGLSTKLFGALAALLTLLHVLNLPFYAGAALGGLSWRMEHGRVTLACSPTHRSQSFWLAPNAEGLRWTPAFDLRDLDAWSLTIPLWLPTVICLGMFLARRRRDRG